MTRAAVALGSNLGDRLATLRGAIEQLAELGDVVAVSSLYETAPVGGPEQDNYYNAVLTLETDLDARTLLRRLHGIESSFGRVRREKWGARTLDLDLVLHGDTVIEAAGITVPHPRYRDRRFVLEPLLEAWPDATHVDGTSLAEALEMTTDQALGLAMHRGWERPDGDSRGVGWVSGQVVVLLATLAAIVFFPGQLRLPAVIGWLVLAAGATQFSVSLTNLGVQTTPYPEPIAGGALVETGIYAYVRHPMYGAVIVMALGAVLVRGSGIGLALWAGLVAFFAVKARHEEGRLTMRYPGYEAYRRRVQRRFVPWVA